MKEARIADEVRLPIDRDTDIVAARQNGRELAGSCGFAPTDQVLVCTAISELASLMIGSSDSHGHGRRGTRGARASGTR